MKRIALHRMALMAALGMIGFGCATSGPAAGPLSREVAVDRSANGSTLSLQPGQRLVVSLPGNPTTGYRWEVVQGAGDVLTEQGDPEYLPAGRALGAGGSYRFIFRAAAAGKTELKLAYRRPFEAGNPAVETFQLAVEVSPQ